MGEKFDALWSGNSASIYQQGIGKNIASDVQSMSNSAKNADYSGINKFLYTWFTPMGGLDFIKGAYDHFTGADKEPNIQYTKTGIAYDANNTDSMINAFNTEHANDRDDTAYTRLFEQLRANGINPALVMGNAAPMSSDAGFSSAYNVNAKDQLNSAMRFGALLVMLLKLLA